MNNHIRALEILVAVEGVNMERYEVDAIEWAIYQLGWRWIGSGPPEKEATYQVLSRVNGKLYPDHAQWCFGNKWDGIPWLETNIVYFRPIDLPEGE